MKALKGLVVMSSELELMASSLFINVVPDMWKAKARHTHTHTHTPHHTTPHHTTPHHTHTHTHTQVIDLLDLTWFGWDLCVFIKLFSYIFRHNEIVFANNQFFTIKHYKNKDTTETPPPKGMAQRESTSKTFKDITFQNRKQIYSFLRHTFNGWDVFIN